MFFFMFYFVRLLALLLGIIKGARSQRCLGRERFRVLRKAVIPAAGLGTRLLSVTKEQPKEMLPVFGYSFLSVRS